MKDHHDRHDRHGKLLSLAVHELRTPLSVVSGYLRMLLGHFGATLTEQQRNLAEQGAKSCGTMADLLNELSDLAKLESAPVSLRRERVALVPLLADLAKDVHEGRDRGITLDVRSDGADLWVLGDAGRLHTAFSTLAVAVLRERADAASMIVACRVIESGGERAIKVAIADAAVIDRVLDDTDQQAFDEYRGGLGFRLLLASGIVGAHGGRIASPVADRGRLAIVVTLPVAPDAETIG